MKVNVHVYSCDITGQKATIHQVTIMLATSKKLQVITTSADDLEIEHF